MSDKTNNFKWRDVLKQTFENPLKLAETGDHYYKVIDNSGKVSPELMQNFLQEIEKIKDAPKVVSDRLENIRKGKEVDQNQSIDPNT